MPTYEYACDACGNDFEVMQKMSDAPVDKCPKCGKNVRKVLSGGIGISFKGSGFYVNDSGGKASSAATTPRKAAQPAGSGSSGD